MEQHTQQIDWSAWDGEFMTAEVIKGAFWRVETDNGTEVIPQEYFIRGDYDNDVEAEICNGYGVRLSASGYLDCTDWSVFDTEQKAFDFLLEMYPPESEKE